MRLFKIAIDVHRNRTRLFFRDLHSNLVTTIDLPVLDIVPARPIMLNEELPYSLSATQEADYGIALEQEHLF